MSCSVFVENKICHFSLSISDFVEYNIFFHNLENIYNLF